MSDSHEQHQSSLLSAFAAVLKAEDRISTAKFELTNATNRLKADIAVAEGALAAAWSDIAALMAETGEVEVTLPGAATDYRIDWSTPRESVVIEEVAAVPDEWVEIERKPKKAEIAKHLRLLRDHQNTAWPNWGRLETGEKKLQWSAVKRK